jgi:hypothetical protein
MVKPKIKGIYAIFINDKPYVGQDSGIMQSKRFVNHLSFLKRDIHHNKEMQKDYNEYGIESVTYSILSFSENYTKDDLNALERHYIEELDTFNNGYNQTIGGIGMAGYPQSAESIEKRASQIRGENNPSAKLTNEQFFEIIGMFKQGATNDDVAEKYDLHSRYVSLIRHKKRFKELWMQVKDYEPTPSHKLKHERKFNYSMFLDIMNMIRNGCTNKDIEDKYSASSGTGSRIRNKILYKDYWEQYEETL